ncbi:protein phosphatase inhibitor domain-containing protein [Pochonia chlamydosporia 170]|uniref:Type 1 phosphatases regulator n=1 Tax=Pochonia chlamydosporia 170 TaxID=1380566 RepID=A0A179G614_METCM|nr:protein phosphatase inhibitor domain-containing protein [Pochonia chlamydosporia 170]OAQ72928.1 protein phosphatase inhibitor domain-containing protein [Pochonia chlamydosporia 170]
MAEQRQRAAPAPAASQTQTESSQSGSRTESPRILRLRGGHNATGRSVQWAEDVVDNEGLGRKMCCIYHKPKGVDESSDESSSSSSDSDTDSEPESRRGDGKKAPACGHSHHGRGRRGDKGRKQKRPPSPNAYEKVPKTKPKDGPGGKAQ